MHALVLKGTPLDEIVIIDSQPSAVRSAVESGYGAIEGSATDEDVLRQALIERAAVVIVAVDRDDAAILATLTVRRLGASARGAAARERPALRRRRDRAAAAG